MENNEVQNALSLSDLWGIFISHMWQIVLVGIVVFVTAFSYAAITYTPEYKSTSTIYILPRSDGKDLTTGDLSIAINTVNDCTEILTSNKVFALVKEELNLVDRIDYRTFKSMISITNEDDSRVLYVSVTAPTPSDAKLIVDALCKIGAEEIVKIMGVDQVNLVDYGTFSENPSNSRFSKMSFVIGFVAALLAYGLSIMIYILDDKINTPDDVEKYLGVSILGIIPDANDIQLGKRYGKYGKYGNYGHNAKQTHKSNKK